MYRDTPNPVAELLEFDKSRMRCRRPPVGGDPSPAVDPNIALDGNAIAATSTSCSSLPSSSPSTTAASSQGHSDRTISGIFTKNETDIPAMKCKIETIAKRYASMATRTVGEADLSSGGIGVVLQRRIAIH